MICGFFYFFREFTQMLRKREAEYRHGPYSACILHASEDELRKVAVDHDVGQAFIDVSRIDDDVLVRKL